MTDENVKKCRFCGRIIKSDTNKVGVCTKCKETGAQGVILPLAAAAFIVPRIKRHGGKAVKIAKTAIKIFRG